jgi:hypothetical protein
MGPEGSACWEEVEVVTRSSWEEKVVVGLLREEEGVIEKKMTEAGRGSLA